MPKMGVPSQLNSFRNLTLKKKEANPSKSNQGEVLNKIAGNSYGASGIQYTDMKKHNKMKKDDFLKLLSHQLQNQDPMKPMDQHKFASDLAQFSQLEQMANMNESLNTMKSQDPAKGKFYAASFLGKKITTQGSTIQIQDPGQAADMSFYLQDNARKVMVRLFDQNNQIVKQIDLEEGLAKGTNTITWDGKSNDGAYAAEGIYRIQVQAWNDKLEPIEVSGQTTGMVTGVSFENGETVFKVDSGKKVFLRDVTSFYMPGESSKTGKTAMTEAAANPLPAQMKNIKPMQQAKEAYPHLKEY